MPAESKPRYDGEHAIVHLSDLHFGSPNYQEVWSLTKEFLREIKPDLLLVTGDLVDSPKKKWYQEAKKSLDELDILYFVCAGNHDRFYRGNQFPSWTQALIRAVCLLVLALSVGTLVWLWNKESVGWLVPFLVGLVVVAFAGCLLPDRLLWIGTRLLVDDHFSEVFLGHILTHETLQPIKIPQRASESSRPEASVPWSIGLFGDDSNTWADASARGYIPTSHFQPIRKTTEGQDCELCLFLVHHHLLSIRRLEEDRRGRFAGLFELTNMVNAGSLLETLSAANVDLVLHGHEHEHNFASYSSLTAGSGPVMVIAAGSATGNQTLVGCVKQRVTFNTLILALDRSVRIVRYWLDAESWRWEEVHRIEASALRLSRLRRLHRSANDLTGEITKYVEFTRQRDIWIYWVYTNRQLRPGEFVQDVGNSTGRVVVPQVRVSAPPFPPRELVARSERLPDKPNTWRIRAQVPEDLCGQIVQLELKYCWRDGAILTREEMEQTAEFRQEHGTPRSEGYEFATGWTAKDLPVAALEVIVVLPQEYSPIAEGTDPEVQVFVKHDGRTVRHHEIELRPQLRILSKGVFALRVDYPQGYHEYQIAWKPVPQATVNEFTQNYNLLKGFSQHARAREQSEALLKTFRGKLIGASFPEYLSLALYVPSQNGPSYLDRVACIGWQNETIPDRDQTPPLQLLLTGSQNVLARAWWGEEPFCVVRTASEKAIRSGFLSSEEAVLGVPIRLSLRSINPPPWGVVRIGMGRKEKLEKLTQESLSTILLDSAIVLLSGVVRADTV